MKSTRILTIALTLFYMTSVLQAEPAAPPEGLQFNRYTTNNFEILSINDGQGKYLKDNIELIKTWIVERAGVDDFNFSKKCMVVVVPTKEMFKDFFKKEDSFYALKQNSEKKDIWVLYLTADNKNWYKKQLPELLTEVCFKEIEQNKNVKIPLAVIKGMSVLNSDIPTIKSSIIELKDIFDKDKKCLWVQSGLLDINEQDLLDATKVSKELASLFNEQSAAFCLMLMKELGGKNKFSEFILDNSKPENRLQKVYKFPMINDEFDRKYKLFMHNLSLDVHNNKTPDEYLSW